MNRQRFAIQLMIWQAVLFAAETAIIHHVGPHVPISELALIRGGAGVVLALALARNVGLAVLRTRHLALQLSRGGVSLLYLWVMIYSFSHLPFADATAISYTQAAYISMFSVLILGEPVARRRWAAVAVGIAGAVLIARPTFASWNNIYLFAIFGSGLNGLAFVLNRCLQQKDSEITTMFYSNIIPVLGSLPVVAMGPIPAADTLLSLSGLLIFGPIGMYAGIVAAKHAQASVLGPYTLLRLVIGVLGGVVIFHELPPILSGVGTVLILASCVSSRSATPGPAAYRQAVP